MRSLARNQMPLSRLPPQLRSLFWEDDFDQLTWRTDQDLIIGRILAAGDWETVQWLLRHAGKALVRDWLERRHGAGLSPKQLRFWEVILHLPTHQVSGWLADPRRQAWEGRRRL